MTLARKGQSMFTKHVGPICCFLNANKLYFLLIRNAKLKMVASIVYSCQLGYNLP